MLPVLRVTVAQYVPACTVLYMHTLVKESLLCNTAKYWLSYDDALISLLYEAFLLALHAKHHALKSLFYRIPYFFFSARSSKLECNI